MCGICGFWQTEAGAPEAELRAQAAVMTAALTRRGPDSAGSWVEGGLVLAHRRLAILDLSDSGAQPMMSESGRYVVSYNGEIYNFRELRTALERGGSQFRGHSDTEVLLGAVDIWGLESAISRFKGMFAFALWDRKLRQLHLARDRFGEKPLYYGRCGDTLLFGSELHALSRHPAWTADVDRGVLDLYLRYGYVPAPWSIFQGIYKLPPGCLMTLTAANQSINPHPEGALHCPKRYWSARKVAQEGLKTPFQGSDGEALETLERLLSASVRRQMVSDVPLGAFLSGGLDSSTVVALMQAQSERPVKTFTIGFNEDAYNEAEAARAVAEHLGTEHTELYLTSSDALQVIARLPSLYTEPFADVSQIPTFLVSRLARQQVTVSLSGDGGDELFCGYNRYFWAPAIWHKVGWLPPVSRRLLCRAALMLSPAVWDVLYRPIDPLLPGKLRQRLPGDRIHKLAQIISEPDQQALYRRLVSFWVADESPVVGISDAWEHRDETAAWPKTGDYTHRMMLMDTLTYLPDDILVKVDRAAMGVSLETRVPFLDPDILAFAWSLPGRLHSRDGRGKWLLRQLLYRHVPRALVDRPKTGFGVPIDGWLRGPLKEWADALLNPKRLESEGYFDSGMVDKRWREHQAGRRNWQYHLWIILMFQAWLENCRMICSIPDDPVKI